MTAEQLDAIQKLGFKVETGSPYTGEDHKSVRITSPDDALVIVWAFDYVVTHPKDEKPTTYDFKKNPGLGLQLVDALCKAWAVNAEKC